MIGAGVVVRLWPLVLVAWAAAVAAAVLLPPPFADVAAVDEQIYLPEGSPALRGEELDAAGWPDDTVSRAATVALVRPDRPLDDADLGYARTLVDWLEGPDAPAAFGAVTTHLRDPDLTATLTSEDGHALLVALAVDAEPYAPETRAAVATLRERLATDTSPQGLDAYVTGTVGIAVDEDRAIQDSVRRTQVLSVLLVVVLLFWVFRAPLAPLVPLVTVGAAYLVALGVVSVLAGLGLEVSYLYETFSIVIVFGAGTDYCLLIMSRYGEGLRAAESHGEQLGGALRRTTLVATMVVLGGVIASSAASTIVGFSAQSLAEFGLFRTMGPALAVTVAIALVAGVTLTPALVRATGRWLFWPGTTGRAGVGTDMAEQDPPR